MLILCTTYFFPSELLTCVSFAVLIWLICGLCLQAFSSAFGLRFTTIQFIPSKVQSLHAFQTSIWTWFASMWACLGAWSNQTPAEFSSDMAMSDYIRKLRFHGEEKEEKVVLLGLNSRSRHVFWFQQISLKSNSITYLGIYTSST
jgi:hypothetical protein